MAPHSRKPKSLVIPGHSLAYCDGGIPAYLLRLLEAFSHLPEVEVDVLLVGDANPPISAANLRYHPFPEALLRGRPLPRQFITTAKMGLHARKVFPGSVLFSASDFWCPLPHPYSVVVTHDMLPELERAQAGSLPRRLIRRCCMRYAAKASRWITISDFAAEEIAGFHTKRRPEVLENWLSGAYGMPGDPSAVAEARTRLRLPESFIVYVGGYRGYKNLDLLLKAHAKARALRPQTSPLVLVGEPPLVNQISGLSSQASSCLQNGISSGSVFLAGKVSDRDLPLVYSAARLYVSASLHEGFGYPPVEAMHRGCPVLVADRTAFRHVVPKLECRFDPDDFDGFVAKLIQADRDPALFRCTPNPLHTFESGVARLASFLQSIA